ncbi:hypothetical protein AAFF_G00355020 [Aldrovandia affinis]|uniref:Uncharacterized protein n=1 Tax=Aldrovandia affinis TaxID=143900 RepID=A0AAD7SJ31_9TELE|nr:hypothetical protein AAFF_G00355020 [Aldrovandia affinis]
MKQCLKDNWPDVLDQSGLNAAIQGGHRLNARGVLKLLCDVVKLVFPQELSLHDMAACKQRRGEELERYVQEKKLWRHGMGQTWNLDRGQELLFCQSLVEELLMEVREPLRKKAVDLATMKLYLMTYLDRGQGGRGMFGGPHQEGDVCYTCGKVG